MLSCLLPVKRGLCRLWPELLELASGPQFRAGLGAASGALGAATIEPMIYHGQQEVQADYTFANSMLNMSFGAIMGGVMHAGGGTFAEWRRGRDPARRSPGICAA